MRRSVGTGSDSSRRRRAAAQDLARRVVAAQNRAAFLLEPDLGGRRCADVRKRLGDARLGFDNFWLDRPAKVDSLSKSCSPEMTTSGCVLYSRSMDAKAVEPPLDLLADLDKVGSFDHDVHGGDNLRLGQRPHVEVCTGTRVSGKIGAVQSWRARTVHVEHARDGRDARSQPVERNR